MPPILLTAREMAERLDVTYDTLLGWARRDEIPSIRDGRGRRYFNLDAVLSSLSETGDGRLAGRRKAVAS